ncbi:caspase family protein [Massilia sp. CCM 9210]|uniref:caspase family protein n=1 Tax=Massilia scottii TaxID=3057166 RepID=UPI002796A64D|nr:caspase family protein [Massilia sp. CCM 9210]MDQ1816374.1 caspase family protein [Massilia sp. CCM 9210]
MIKNIALILGVTDYVDTTVHLPACKKDVELLEKVLRLGGHFNEIIVIPSGDAQGLKAKLAETVQRFQNEDVQDLFFYFTGHGEFKDDGFNYLLRDYSKSRSAATSLSNSELDGMLKSLLPKLTVKVVDACYSGMAYIKDGSSFDDYIKSSNTFSNCYFLFSSQSDQKSYADENISDFTYEFAKSIASSTSDSVRYKDIIDSISDAFAIDSKQRPLFVSQADYTETFGNYPSTAREQISALITIADQKNESANHHAIVRVADTVEDEPLSLLALVEADSHRYFTLEEARSLVVALKSALEMPPSELDGIYEIIPTWFDDYDSLPNPRALGEWVKSNKEQEYFAAPTIGAETYEADVGMSAIFRLSGLEPKTVTKTRQVITGLESSVEGLPFLAYRLALKPKHPNLIQYAAWFTFIISKTQIQIFLSFVEYSEVSWDKYRPGLTTQWERHGFVLKSAQPTKEIVKTFYTQFIEWTTERVKARLEKNKAPGQS